MNLVVPDKLAGPLGRIAARAERYVRQCTALEVGPGRVAILADHRLLPLSWTRDAYYQALLLLVAPAKSTPRRPGAEIVADHLRWLWLECVRPGGGWARSHHADGRRKDERFQADQQLYPLLELCDYATAVGQLPTLGAGDEAAERGAWSRLVAAVLAMLDRSSGQDGMLASEENAADDEAGLPYQLSTQILAWYTFRRLAGLGGLLELSDDFAERAEKHQQTVARHFTTDYLGRPTWAYASDGRGRRLFYHDANDLPTALAPVWGFCAPGDPAWRATMDLAFSPHNDAYVAGQFGGLGSRHTRGTWSLGLIQEWVARSLAGEPTGAADALRRLVAVALDDWMLPEASDPTTGRLAARPWFAWPGAAVGALSAVHLGEVWPSVSG